MRLRRLFMSTLACGLVAALCAGANAGTVPLPSSQAGTFDVNPVQITIQRGATSGSITVRAVGGDEGHYTVAGYHWKQDASGKPQLEPADDLVFFPQSFTLGDGQVQRIRVGAQVAPSAVEQSYRLVVYKLPPKADRANGKARALAMGVGVKIGIPVFIEPENPKSSAAIDVPSIRANTLPVSIAATGNTHVSPAVLRIVASDASGNSVVETKTNVWYVLAGDTSTVNFPILHAQCEAVTRVKVDLQDPLGNTIAHHDVAAPKKACS
jgi:P pilus assembly chaperone PapD